MTQRIISAPIVTPETEHFWQAAQQGRFLLRRCTACHETHWYPRAICPFCLGDTVWQEHPGAGTIYSWTVMRREAAPFAMGYVALDDGPTMLADFTGIEFDRLKIGMRVKLAWSDTVNGAKMPSFTGG
ncbi:MAG: OB-fold domain-containing protein [Acetobacteraceae bacterium]|nr:OB-fold domain-containing protein [Acetobacteraceae bacterium]